MSTGSGVLYKLKLLRESNKTSPTALARYEPQRSMIIAADASGHGLGAVLMQVQDNGDRRPVCFASRALTAVEQRYAVIEKEALAATWSCDKFADYVLGMTFTLETDHKPLVPLLSSTDLAKMPPRIQRFRMRMVRYNPEVQYVQGRLHVSADALSRAPVGSPSTADMQLIEEVDTFADMSSNALPASAVKLQQIKTAQKEDEVCAEIRRYCHEGWPAFMPHTPLLRPYWESRSHLATIDDLLLYDERIVIPRCMQLETLKIIHEGHLGISKCRARANTAVWWPGLSKEIYEMVSTCHTCAKVHPEPKETLMSASFPSRPWERVGMDLFELNGKLYLVIVDYYSRWVEFRKLTSLTSEHTIEVMKEVFATHGIPDVIMSDNGPQFSAEAFLRPYAHNKFAKISAGQRRSASSQDSEGVDTAHDTVTERSEPRPIADGTPPANLATRYPKHSSARCTGKRYTEGKGERRCS